MNRNSPYRCSWPYRYRNLPYWYTNYSTPFAVNQSLSESIQPPTNFLFQETGTDTFSSSHAKLQQFFPLSISLVRVAFSLVILWKVFQMIAWGVNTDASTWLLPWYLFCTCILADLGPCSELLTKHMSILVQPFARLARIASQNFEGIFSPATISLASLHKTHTCTRPPRQLRTNWFSIKWQTWSQLEYMAPATRCYNVHIHIQFFSANLDKSWEWPSKPTKRWNSGESRKTLISDTYTHIHTLSKTIRPGSLLDIQTGICIICMTTWLIATGTDIQRKL